MSEVLSAGGPGSTREVPTVLSCDGVVQEFTGGDGAVLRILDGVSLEVARGEMVAIVGASGAGKSTLLHVLGGLERPAAGTVRYGAQLTAGLDDAALDALRNRHVGFVFQFHHLLREFTALENVMMPLRIGGMRETDARERAVSLLERMGLGARLQHRPTALSGGEQQRTAVARALAARPSLLLADEPSGNLDAQNAAQLHDLFAELAREQALGIVVVTHNPLLAARADRVLLLDGGRLAAAPDFGTPGH